MEEDKLIDQSQLAESVAEKIKYEFARLFLVKPLDPVIVKKEFDKPVAKGQSKEDENGIDAVDYDTVEKEVKDVESDYLKGIVLKVPYQYVQQATSKEFAPMPIKCGDVVIFKATRSTYFDLVKDTKLVEIYDILGKEVV